ncbi:MAG: gliding motility-associated C-terminal domain-containing protein [Bacteroidota bacterium]
MKYPRSLSTLFVLSLFFYSWQPIKSQTNCDSLDYALELFSPDVYEAVEYGEIVELVFEANFPNWQISTIEWSSEFSLQCNDCLTNSFVPTDTTTVQVEVTLNDGCVVSDELTINVFLRKDFFVPNAFSPNNDGFNDDFVLFAYENAVRQFKSIQVYSRKGHVVYEAYNLDPGLAYHFGWNGRFRGKKLNAEVYIWKMTIEYVNGEEETHYGTVSLMR